MRWSLSLVLFDRSALLWSLSYTHHLNCMYHHLLSWLRIGLYCEGIFPLEQDFLRIVTSDMVWIHSSVCIWYHKEAPGPSCRLVTLSWWWRSSTGPQYVCLANPIWNAALFTVIEKMPQFILWSGNISIQNVLLKLSRTADARVHCCA